MYSLLRLIGHQDWIRYGIRYRLIKLFVPLSKVDKEIEVDFFGLNYFGNLKYSIDWAVYFFGAYEKKQLLWIKNLLVLNKKTGVALDIGANVGNHTLFLSTFFGKVNSFEPYPPIFERLNKHVISNKLKNVVLHPVALSDRNATLPFYPPQTNNIGMGTLNSQRVGGNVPSINIDIYKGDSYCEEHGINAVDFIKIDVEGHELEAFKGLTKTIKANNPFIWFEFSPSDGAEGKSWIFNTLLSDYSFYRLDSFQPLDRGDIKALTNELDILALPKSHQLWKQV